MSIYCGNNFYDSVGKTIGTPYQCLKKGIGTGLHASLQTYNPRYAPIDQTNKFCGDSQVPPGMVRGSRADCFRKGYGTGLRIQYERIHGPYQDISLPSVPTSDPNESFQTAQSSQPPELSYPAIPIGIPTGINDVTEYCSVPSNPSSGLGQPPSYSPPYSSSDLSRSVGPSSYISSYSPSDPPYTPSDISSGVGPSRYISAYSPSDPPYTPSDISSGIGPSSYISAYSPSELSRSELSNGVDFNLTRFLIKITICGIFAGLAMCLFKKNKPVAIILSVVLIFLIFFTEIFSGIIDYLYSLV